MATNHADSYALAALATAAVPGLDVSAVALTGQTDDFTFAIAEDTADRRWVIRRPRHQAAGAAADREIKLLRSLDGSAPGRSLPFEVINPIGFVTATDGLTAMVYREPPGDPLVMELLEPGPGLAASVGRTLAALHQVAPELADQAGLPSHSPQAYRGRLRQEVDRAEGTGMVPASLVARWRGRLDQDTLWVFSPVVIHGDMAPEHVMVQGGRVAAMLNLTSAQVSDPAEDLVPLLTAGPPEVAESILEAYHGARADFDDPHLRDRISLLAEIAVIRWLFHGLDHQDQAVINDAQAMLGDLDQTVAAEQAEAARLAAQAEETSQRLEAAKRASVAAAREHQRVLDTDLLRAQTGSDDSTQVVSSAQWAPVVGQDMTVSEGTEDDFWPVPERRSVAAEGIDMWGQTGRTAPAWEDESAVSAASIPPPGLDDTAADLELEPDSEPEPESTWEAQPRPDLEPGPDLDPEPESTWESQLDTDSEPGPDPDPEPQSTWESQPRPLAQDQAANSTRPDAVTPPEDLPDFLQDSMEAPIDLPIESDK